MISETTIFPALLLEPKSILRTEARVSDRSTLNELPIPIAISSPEYDKDSSPTDIEYISA